MTLTRVAISISESNDLRELGMGGMHLQDALVETARQVLRKGYALAYGGDLGYEGEYNFSQLLMLIARTYGVSEGTKVYNYSAFPMSAFVTEEKEAEIRSFAEVVPIIPANLGAQWKDVRYENANADQRKELDDIMRGKHPDAEQIWAECLTEMRQQMARECPIRIVLGGKTKGSRGRYAGIMEETRYAIQNNGSVIIDGRFGGASRAMIGMLDGTTEHVDAKNFPPDLGSILRSKPVVNTGDVAFIGDQNVLNDFRNILTWL
jgi:hypothetical protein